MPPERIRTVNVAERPTSVAGLGCRRALEGPARVKEVGLVSARDRATGEMSVVARREIATWSFRPSCEWMSRRSLPNKMSLEAAPVIFIPRYRPGDLLLAPNVCSSRTREEHVFHQHVLLESLSLDDPAQIGAVQLIKSAADKALKLN